MVTSTTDEGFIGPVAVSIGTAGTPASVSIGYIVKGEDVEISHGAEQHKLEVSGKLRTQASYLHTRVDTIKIPALQFDETLLNLAVAGSASGKLITLSGAGEVSQISLALTGETVNGTTQRLDILYAVSMTDLSLALAQTHGTSLALSFEAQGDDDEVYWTVDNSNVVVTPSTGVVTRSAAFHLIAGEGGAADTVTSITAGDLVDGEILVLKIEDVDEPITFTHAADTIELDGDADWTMTKLNDSLTLQYAAGDTEWVEIGRYNAQS